MAIRTTKRTTGTTGLVPGSSGWFSLIGILLLLDVILARFSCLFSDGRFPVLVAFTIRIEILFQRSCEQLRKNLRSGLRE